MLRPGRYQKFKIHVLTARDLHGLNMGFVVWTWLNLVHSRIASNSYVHRLLCKNKVLPTFGQYWLLGYVIVFHTVGFGWLLMWIVHFILERNVLVEIAYCSKIFQLTRQILMQWNKNVKMLFIYFCTRIHAHGVIFCITWCRVFNSCFNHNCHDLYNTTLL